MSPVALHLAILRSAALLVPEQQRAEWLAEWTSEIWHARRNPRAKQVMASCLGAFKDAFWLRRYGPVPRSYGVLHLDVPAVPALPEYFPTRELPLLSSPIRCLSLLAIFATLAITSAFLLPYARKLILVPWYHDGRNLVMLTPAADWDANGFWVPYLSVSVEQFQSLRDHPDNRFGDLAFYLPIRMQVGATKLLVAQTSADLFRMLGIPIPAGNGPRLILADSAWKSTSTATPEQSGGRSRREGARRSSLAFSPLANGILPVRWTAGYWRMTSRTRGCRHMNEGLCWPVSVAPLEPLLQRRDCSTTCRWTREPGMTSSPA